MAQRLALVVSHLHPYLADLRLDAVYVAIEFDDPTERPHRASVMINGIRKGDYVMVSFQDSEDKNRRNYAVMEKVYPPASTTQGTDSQPEDDMYVPGTPA